MPVSYLWLRKKIKRLFNVDVHTLRHCFATNLELRYLAAKYPETRTLLNLPWDEDPLTPEALSSFLNFLNWGHRGKFEQHCHSHHFHIISMMMGHGSIKTTHTHYVHGFGVVNAFHALHSSRT